MEFPDGALPPHSIYKLMTGLIVPRPIGWISSLSKDGIPNLAPFSFFTGVCSNPPHLLYCVSNRPEPSSHKDSYTNVRDTGEFVVNIVSRDLANAMNETAGEFPPEIDEFDIAHLTKIPSHAVKPPRVAESVAHLECRLTEIVTVSEEVGGAHVMIGRIVHMHVDERVLLGQDKINTKALAPIGRLAGSDYCQVDDIFQIVRPR